MCILEQTSLSKPGVKPTPCAARCSFLHGNATLTMCARWYNSRFVSPEKLVRLQVYNKHAALQELVLQSCSWTAGMHTQVALAPNDSGNVTGRASSLYSNCFVSDLLGSLIKHLRPGNMVPSCALGSNGTAHTCMQSVRIGTENCQNSGLVLCSRQTIGQRAKTCLAQTLGEKKPLKQTLGTFTHKANATTSCSAPGLLNVGKSLRGFRNSSWGREVRLHQLAGGLRKVIYKICSRKFIYVSLLVLIFRFCFSDSSYSLRFYPGLCPLAILVMVLLYMLSGA